MGATTPTGHRKFPANFLCFIVFPFLFNIIPIIILKQLIIRKLVFISERVPFYRERDGTQKCVRVFKKDREIAVGDVFGRSGVWMLGKKRKSRGKEREF